MKYVILYVIAVIFQVAMAADGAWVEQNQMVVVEVENAPLAGSWARETAVTGFSGTCYYTWRGGSATSITSAGQGVLAYQIKITTPGTWYFRFHNYHNYPADQTQQNDTWVKMDNGSWVKCYQNSGKAGYWNFYSTFEIGDAHVTPTYNLSAGYHTIYFSGRSYGHSIDRFHLSLGRAIIGTSFPESPREGDVPPDTGSTAAVSITSPGAGATLAMGSTITLTGEGDNLSWSYDANSDGLGAVRIGSGASVSFTVPTGIKTPMELTLTLTGDGGTDQRTYNLTTATGVFDRDEAIRILTTGSTMTVVNVQGRRIKTVNADGLQNRIWQQSLPCGVYHCLLPNGQIRKLTVIH